MMKFRFITKILK